MIYQKGRYVYRTALCLVAVFLITGCGKLKGQFAFRSPGQEVYRRIDGVPEFRKEEKVEWVFVFKKLSDRHKIGVVLMKQELVWVDLTSRMETVMKGKEIIYGDIQNLDEGRYRIVIANEDSLIADKEFVIFSDSDEY